MAHLAPFYLREHSKRILRGALFNDSKFLADINVMDYSLVVGVDSVKNELVVGIVGACSFYLGFTSMIHGLTCGFFFGRLHPDIYVGQEIRELGQGLRVPGWSEQRGAHHYWAKAV